MNKDINSAEDESESIQQIYAALGHAIRYDIVKYLGAFHRPINYTELVEWLQVKPGSFYFHIKKLRHLISQDEEKKFHLTSTGHLALDIIKSGEVLHSKLQPVEEEKKENLNTLPRRFTSIFFGELIRKKAFDTQFKVGISFLIISQIILLELSKLGIIPFFLDGGLYFGIIGCIIEFLTSILVVWISLEIIMRNYSPIKGFSHELLIGMP
ncbi:MAG: winged helix-turn-helix domain-containing protein, partial [Candidatus Hodarchaeales archaeon]